MTSSTRSAAARVAVAALLVVAGVGGVVAPATAGSAGVSQSGETESDERAESGAQNESNSATTIEAQIDREGIVTVVSKRYNASSQTFYLTVRNDGREDATLHLSEVVESDPSSSGGSDTFALDNFEIESGETVTVSLRLFGSSSPPGVMVTTDRSLEQGRGEVLWAETDSGGGLLEGRATWADVWVGVGFSILVSAVVVVFGVWYVVARESNDIQEVPVK